MAAPLLWATTSHGGATWRIIQSATGPLDTANMGFTLMHERIAVRWLPIYQAYPELWERERRMAEAVDKLKAAHKLICTEKS